MKSEPPKRLRELGENGDEAELRTVSDEFRGDCFALTLLDSYLTDAYHGGNRCRSKVSGHLAYDQHREFLDEQSWNYTKLGLERVLSWPFSAC